MEAVSQAIANQDTILGQHDQALNQIIARLEALSASVTDIQEHLTNQAAVENNNYNAAAAAAANAPVPDIPPAREIPVPAPERYAGDLGACQAFLMQCSLVFEQQPRTFAADRSRICYLLGLLKGPALTWGAAVWEEQSLVCQSYVAFTGELKKVFDHPVRGKEATRRLMSLRQGARSVAEFAVEFRTLAAESGWNDEALQGAFHKALNDDIKDEIASRDDSNNLDELIRSSIRLDNRLRERKRERAFRAQRGGSTSGVPPQGPAPFQVLPPSGAPSPRGSEPRRETQNEVQFEPMEVARAHLSPEEKTRRIQSKSCLYCGHAGHFISSCPIRPVKDVARQ